MKYPWIPTGWLFCKAALNGRPSKRIGYETAIVHYSDTDSYAIRYHETDIVTFLKHGSALVNLGDWQHSPTTRGRVNRALRDYGFQLYQSKHVVHYSWRRDGFETSAELGAPQFMLCDGRIVYVE